MARRQTMTDVAHADQGTRGKMPQNGIPISPAQAEEDNCEGCTVCDLPLEGQEWIVLPPQHGKQQLEDLRELEIATSRIYGGSQPAG